MDNGPKATEHKLTLTIVRFACLCKQYSSRNCRSGYTAKQINFKKSLKISTVTNNNLTGLWRQRGGSGTNIARICLHKMWDLKLERKLPIKNSQKS